MHVVRNSQWLVLIRFVPSMVSEVKSFCSKSVGVVYVVDKSFIVGLADANLTLVLNTVNTITAKLNAQF